jgi:hypothetical protein
MLESSWRKGAPPQIRAKGMPPLRMRDFTRFLVQQANPLRVATNLRREPWD